MQQLIVNDSSMIAFPARSASQRKNWNKLGVRPAKVQFSLVLREDKIEMTVN